MATDHSDYPFKEVRFDIYCAKCEHALLKDTEEPCYECLKSPTNWCSCKPVKFKAKDT